MNIYHTDEVCILSIYICVCVCVFIDVFPTLISVLFIVCEMNNNMILYISYYESSPFYVNLKVSSNDQYSVFFSKPCTSFIIFF